MRMGCISFQDIDSIVNILTLIVLSVTMVYVIKYWCETQQMKKEMIKQREISIKNIKIQNMPVIDLELEVVKHSQDSVQGVIQYAYDLFLENRGNGPAFNIHTKRFPTPKNDLQKRTMYKESIREIEPFIKETKMLGVKGKAKIYREYSGSYGSFKIEVSYQDHFGERHSIVFCGDRNGINISRYEHQKYFYS